MELEKYLQSIGLGEKEIKVYLICLELGESFIMPIVEKVKLPRTTVFHILENLRNYDLVEILENVNRRVYSPYPPEKILNLLNAQKNTINQEIESFNNFLPELRQKYELTVHEPKIRIFRGEEIKQIYEEILISKIKEVIYVSEVRQIEEVLSRKYLKNWINRRIKRNIWSKCVWVKEEEVKDVANYRPSRDNLRIVRYAPKGFACPAQMMIYAANVVTITTAKENIGVMVTSKDYAETMKSWFAELWKISSKN